MADLHVSVLGGLSVSTETGGRIVFPTKKSKALLAYLAAARGKPLSREHLAGMFWGRSAEEQARASLRQTLTALRKALSDKDESLLIADSESIALAATRVHVDALEFASVAAGETSDALRHAVQLYQGEFLGGFSLKEEAFEEWALAERRRYQQLAIEALTRLLALQEKTGEWPDAIQTASRLLAIDPLQESAHRALMRLYWHGGRREAALQQYDTCAALLQRELGIGPEPATESLRGEILARQPPATAHDAATAASAEEQVIRFCTTGDGVRIAYAVVGRGPPLVKAANWLSHLEYDWRSPVWRHWLDGLSRRHTLIRYDERGCGLSDWDVPEFSFEAWVHDLEAVVDGLNLDRFPLIGISQGGPVAIAYAVRHPERVTHLILYGTYARGKFRRDPSQKQRQEEQALIELIKLGWGKENPAFRQVFTSLFIPEGTPEQHRWFNELQRVSTSPGNAARFVSQLGTIDVSDLAPKVTVPTAVLHARGDARIPFAEGRLLAALIPNARFVPIEGKNHILLQGEAAWPEFLSHVHHFLEN